ncbi:unnamed protein product [Ceutorhynchus assimilis]|uniref:MADF domain-containing protein n=1 Tax=Ceutorhynchus assimilis TaxID=467358 RepID=A0A9P0DP52_9CUCU|nr:unnamed protein product [Ceutorhynchus assimilis]
MENAWKSVAAIVKTNVEACKELWKSLKSKYIRERRLMITMPSGTAAYPGNWPLFKAMAFLAPTIQTRSQCENTQSGIDLDGNLRPTSQLLSFEEVETHGDTEISLGSSGSGLKVIYPVSSTSKHQELEIAIRRKQQNLEAPLENPIPSTSRQNPIPSTSRHQELEIPIRRRRQ